MTILGLQEEALPRTLAATAVMWATRTDLNHSTIKSLDSYYMSETVWGAGDKGKTEKMWFLVKWGRQASIFIQQEITKTCCDAGDGDGDSEGGGGEGEGDGNDDGN